VLCGPWLSPSFAFAWPSGLTGPCGPSMDCWVLWFKYEMSPQAYVLRAWFPTSIIILGGGRNFRRWPWLEEVGRLGSCL
jgi:hypothetical protein